MLKVVVADEAARAELASSLDEICREGARRVLAAAPEEADAYVADLAAERDEHRHRLVARNGHARPRTITTGAGAIKIRAPGRRPPGRSRHRREAALQELDRAAVVPQVAKVAEVLPLLYLHGLSTGDFTPALEGFFGTSAGLSSPVITRLAKTWTDGHRAFTERCFAIRDFVYVWVEGVHCNVPLEGDRSAAWSW